MFEELATLRAVNRMLRLIMHHLPDTLGGAYDLDGNLIVIVGPIENVPTVSAIEGQHYLSFTPAERREKLTWLFKKAKGGLEVSTEYPIGERIFEAWARPVFDERETIHAVLVYVRDVTAERLATKALKERQRDTLTGLPKRSVLYAFVDGLITRSAIFHVLYIDLDNFKAVNDGEGGHARGDQLLERVSNELRGSVRANDLATRQGGDEFVCILTNTTAPLDAARRILQRVLMVTASFGAGASCGLSSFPEDGKSIEELLQKADDALRTSKQTGKSRVTSKSGTFEVMLPPTIPPLIMTVNVSAHDVTTKPPPFPPPPRLPPHEE